MKLTKFAREQFKSLVKGLEGYAQSADAEILHDIRLEIKKIKSLIQLTEFSVPGFKGHKHFKPLRTIFRRAGAIREPKLANELFLKYEMEGTEKSLASAQHHEIDLSSEFQEGFLNFEKAVTKIEGKLEKYLKQIRHRHVKKYINKRKEELRQHLQAERNRHALHKARKLAKEIIYLSKVIENREKKLNPFYDNLQVAIGQWHDKQMLMHFIKSKSALRQRLQAECREDQRTIIKLYSEFYA